MDFQKLIFNRESIRDYDPGKTVEKEILARILESGRLAPSAANKQPWKFYLISSKENLSKIRTCYGSSWFQGAPHVLVVAGKKESAWTRQSDGYNSLETDLTIAMDHMILAAEVEGIGTCWIAAFDPEAIKNTGLFDNDEIVFAITPLGYQSKGFTKSGSKNRKPFNEVVSFI